jgi:hypothetical protein
MPRPKIAAKKGKTQATEKMGAQTETRTGTPDAPKTQEQLIDELVAKIKENVEKGGKFIQVSDTFRKVGPGLSLTGLQRVYKQPEKADFLYTQQYKFAGSTPIVEQLLSKFGTSVAAQREKNDIVDVANHQNHLVVRPPQPAVAEIVISHDKMSELVKLMRQNRTAVKEEKGSPKKKRAQRRKSHTGVHVAPRIVVDRLTATLASIADVVRQLSERQLGLDVTHVTFEDAADGLVAVGGRTGRTVPNPRSKRVSVEYSGGHLLSETSSSLEAFLRKIGHSDAEVTPLLTAFSTALETSKVSKTDAGKTEAKSEGADKPKAKPKAKQAPKTVVAPGKEEVEEKVVDSKKPETKSKLRSPPKVTKAKTRTVKPRTSNE